MELCASLFTDHRHVILFFACLIFAVGLDREIILTAKFSQSTVVTISDTNGNFLVVSDTNGNFLVVSDTNGNFSGYLRY